MTATGQGELAVSVRKLDPFVTEGPAGLELRAPEDVLAEIPAEHLDQLRTALAEKNAEDQHAAERGAAVAGAEVWRGEHGYLKHHWYGWELGMDSYLASKVTAGTVTAGGVAAGVGVSTTGPAAGIIAAGFTLITGMIMACKHEDGWTYIYLLGMPPFIPGGVVCNPFG